MISSSTFHVISTELVVGSFAMSGLCFLLHALCRYELIKSQNLISVTDNVAHFALMFGIVATPFAIFSGISASPGSGLSTPILVNKMFLSMTGLGLGLAALISRWKMGSSILIERKPMLLQTFTGMSASGLMLLTASAGGTFARGESLLDILSLPYDIVILMPVTISVILLISGLATTASALWKILGKSTV
tara:strand:- start:34 stop:606 length:573 start_codon:yes stop_codon:yes gene_type:complete